MNNINNISKFLINQKDIDKKIISKVNSLYYLKNNIFNKINNLNEKSQIILDLSNQLKNTNDILKKRKIQKYIIKY